MSLLISRIILTILMFPLGLVVYILVMAVVVAVRPAFFGPGAGGFAVAGAVTWGFLAGYWFLLWRALVRWTPQRKTMSILCVPAALIGGAAIGGVFGGLLNEAEAGLFLASVATPLLWLVGTVLVWRETVEERMQRLRSTGRQSIICPTCGYNLTGLHECRCPECGTQFMLDELLAAQPGAEAAEIEK